MSSQCRCIDWSPGLGNVRIEQKIGNSGEQGSSKYSQTGAIAMQLAAAAGTGTGTGSKSPALVAVGRLGRFHLGEPDMTQEKDWRSD